MQRALHTPLDWILSLAALALWALLVWRDVQKPLRSRGLAGDQVEIEGHPTMQGRRILRIDPYTNFLSPQIPHYRVVATDEDGGRQVLLYGLGNWRNDDLTLNSQRQMGPEELNY